VTFAGRADAQDALCSEIMAPLLSSAGYAESIAFSPDGRFLAVATGRRLTVWDLAKGARVPAFDRRQVCRLGNGESHVAFIHDDLHVARVMNDGVEIYGPDDKPPAVARYRLGVEASAISGPAAGAAFFQWADPTLVDPGSGPARLTIVDARSGAVRKALQISPAGPSLLRFSPDGGVVAVAASDPAAVLVIGPPQYNHPHAASEPSAGPPTAPIDVFDMKTGRRARLTAPANHFAALAVSPRGTRVAAIAVQKDPGAQGLFLVTVWKAPGWKIAQPAPLTPDTYQVLEFADDEHLVAMGHGGFAWITLTSGRVDHVNRFPGFDAVQTAAVSPDGKILAVGGGGDHIEFVGLPALNLIRVLK
jgi:WD40 repeat protein